MKSIISLLILCGVFTMTACSNTAHGMKNDWNNNIQKITDATNGK